MSAVQRRVRKNACKLFSVKLYTSGNVQSASNRAIRIVRFLHLTSPSDVVTSQSLATFKERLKYFCSVTPLTTIDFVACLCSHLGLRWAKILSNLLTYLLYSVYVYIMNTSNMAASYYVNEVTTPLNNVT